MLGISITFYILNFFFFSSFNLKQNYYRNTIAKFDTAREKLVSSESGDESDIDFGLVEHATIAEYKRRTLELIPTSNDVDFPLYKDVIIFSINWPRSQKNGR